jgi:ABC-type transport system involved in cytochrome c biogenesis permease subunit
MIWNWLTTTLVIFLLSWLSGGIIIMFTSEKSLLHRISKFFPLIGNSAILVFIILLWISLDRPPMRTMAETRLWYSFFVAWITWIIYLRTSGKAMYWLGFAMATVFLVVDILHPEYQSKSLMPALQSPWFIPHVVVYMISYAVLGAACISSIKGLYSFYTKSKSLEKDILLAIRLVYPGLGLLTLGMLMGALWAKIAWGNYWSWDPKETWALLTWLFYLITIHLHHSFPEKKKLLLWVLGLSFIVLIITWLGIQYIAPSMQSVHIYAG